MFPIVINYILHLATASIAHRTIFFDLPWPDILKSVIMPFFIELIVYDGKDILMQSHQVRVVVNIS